MGDLDAKLRFYSKDWKYPCACAYTHARMLSQVCRTLLAAGVIVQMFVSLFFIKQGRGHLNMTILPRFALPVVHGRGAGLANEMIPWAKAYIASRALRIRLLHPAWGANHRQYWRFFGTSRLDWIFHRSLINALPSFEFTRNDLRSGESLHDAFIRFGKKHDLNRRPSYVLALAGLWGGIDILSDAKTFLYSQLLSAKGTLENLYELERSADRGKLQVGIHIRQGDFEVKPQNADFRGKFNCRIPLPWYQNIVRQLSRHFGDNVALRVYSDAAPTKLSPLTREFTQLQVSAQPSSDISDLIALSHADLIVCSVSSYSIWAAFLGNARYLWLAANLNSQAGYGTIWGYEEGQAHADSETLQAIAESRRIMAEHGRLSPRGIPVDWDGVMSSEFLADLEQIIRTKRRSTDLIRYGAVPTATSLHQQ